MLAIKCISRNSHYTDIHSRKVSCCRQRQIDLSKEKIRSFCVWPCAKESPCYVCLHVTFDTQHTIGVERQAPIPKNYDLQKPSAAVLLNHELMWSCRRRCCPLFNTIERERDRKNNAFDFFLAMSFGFDLFSIAFQICMYVWLQTQTFVVKNF